MSLRLATLRNLAGSRVGIVGSVRISLEQRSYTKQFGKLHIAFASSRPSWYDRNNQNLSPITSNSFPAKPCDISTSEHRTLYSCLHRWSTTMTAEEWPQHEYTAIATATLDAIYEAAIAASEENLFGPDFDGELASGVVRLYLGDENGTYVANTQTPNRQIWLSSPISGPWRYDWHPNDRVWRSTRDGHLLTELLEKELSGIAGTPIEIVDPNTALSGKDS